MALIALCCALGGNGFQQPLITYRDANIAVEQSIGTPSQKLRLVVNLRSAVDGTTQVAGACCARCCNQRRFVPWESSSFREINNDANLYTLAEDVAQFPNGVGGYISSPTPLILVSGPADWPLLDWDKHLDGFANFGYTGTNSTFVDILFNHVKPQFALYAHRTCNNSYAIAGSVAYGTLQNDGCNPFQFRPLKRNEFGQVLLPLQKLSLGGIDVDAQQSGQAILGSDFAITMPEAVFRQLNATLRASGTGYDLFVVDCNLKPGPMTLTFSDGVTYIIPFSQLVTNVDGVCTLNIMTTSQFVIGLPFLREYCVAVDYENKRLGFATHRQPVAGECKYGAEPKATTCPDTRYHFDFFFTSTTLYLHFYRHIPVDNDGHRPVVNDQIEHEVVQFFSVRFICCSN